MSDRETDKGRLVCHAQGSTPVNGKAGLKGKRFVYRGEDPRRMKRQELRPSVLILRRSTGLGLH
jgi:hypothetical protein